MQDQLLSLQPEIGVDGRRLLELLRRRPLLIAVTAAIAPIIAFLYLSRKPPVYQAQASLVIDSVTPQYLGQDFRDVVDIENNWWSAQEYLSTQYRIIQSRATAVATALDLCTTKDPIKLMPEGKDGGKTVVARLTGQTGCGAEVLGRAAQMLESRLEVAPVKESRVVNLVVKDSDPYLARALANSYADTYTRLNLERRLATSEGAANWLGDEYGDLTTQLHTSEQALVNFKKENRIVSLTLDDQQNELSQRRRKIVDELATVQLKLITLRAQREQYEGLRERDPLKDTTPELQDNPVIQRLKETYATEYQKLIDLQGKYLDKHPAILAHEARLEAIRADIKNEARLSLQALDGAYNAKLKEEKDLSVEFERTTQQALLLESRATEYNRLKRNFERLQKLSEQIGGREKESSLAAHLKTNNVYILDRAQLPEAAIRPNPLTVCGGALVVGLLLGLGLAFLLDMLDSSIKTQEDIETRMHLPFLGIVPRIQAAERENLKGPPELFIHDKPKSPIAECCRSIRTSLMFMSPDKPLRKILVTSGEPQEGKSMTAVNLSITLAQSGQRVLLIDTDMRRPRIHKIFKLPMLTGFSSLVAGEGTIEGAVRGTEVPNLSVIPCGPIPPNPSELLHSERCKTVLAELCERFDRVVLDSPPLAVVTDAAILSQLCDGTVLVAKSGKTSRELLARERKMLVDIKSNILGCVLNDLDLANRTGYGYRYYHYRYGQYYGDDASPKASASASASGGS